MGTVNLRFATFGQRGINRTVTGDDQQLVDVRGPAGAPNLVDASSTELGNGDDQATAELSTTGIDTSTFLIGGATTGTLDMQVFNSSRVRASSRAETGNSMARASYRASSGTPNAFNPSRINGGVIQSGISTGGNSYVSSVVGFNATADAASGGFPTAVSTGTAMVDSAEGYGWYNSDLSANRTDAAAAPTGLDGLGGLLAAGVGSSFDATATMAGTGDASAASTGQRQVGISSRYASEGSGTSLLFGFDGAAVESESVVVVDGAADVTNAATASANSGSTDASAAIAGVAGILNDYQAEPDASSGNFDITINAAFGDVRGEGILANTASATSANGSSSATAGSSFVGGVIDALQVLAGVTPFVGPDGSFNIEFGLDGIVDGFAEADSEATAFTGDGESGDATFASAGNNNVTGVSVAGVQFDRDGEMVTEAVNRENATATTTRSGAAAEAYAGSYDSSAVLVGSRTKGLLSTRVNTGRDLFTSGRRLTLSDPLLAKADARGSAVASSVSANATAEAAESAEVFGIDQSTITVGGDVLSAAGPGEGLLGVNAYQQYSATATATSAAGLDASAIATAGDDGAAVKGINDSEITAGDGHLAAFATNSFLARATTTGTGVAVANTDHEAVGIDDSTIDIGGGENEADFAGFQFSGLQAQGQSLSVVEAETADGSAYGNSTSSSYGIRLTNGVDAVEVGLGDIRAFGYTGVGGFVDGSDTADLDASYSAVGIKTASGDTVAVGDLGEIFAEASIYGVDAGELAFGDPGLLAAIGDVAITNVDFGEVSGIIGEDASDSPASYTAGANGGNITGDAEALLEVAAFGGDSATVNIGQANQALGGDEVTGIRTANLNLGTSGLVPGGVATGSAAIDTVALAEGEGTATDTTTVAINRTLNAIGLRGGSRILTSGRNSIVGASSVVANGTNTSFTDAMAIYGTATVTDTGSAGGMINYDTYTFGNGTLTSGVGLNVVGRATTFQFTAPTT